MLKKLKSWLLSSSETKSRKTTLNSSKPTDANMIQTLSEDATTRTSQAIKLYEVLDQEETRARATCEIQASEIEKLKKDLKLA